MNSNEIDQAVAALPPTMAAAVSSAIARANDNIVRTKYAINLGLSNLDDTFRTYFFIGSLLTPLRQNVSAALISPTTELRESLVGLLQRAYQIQDSRNDGRVHAPIGRILRNAINDGTECVQNYGLTVSNALVTRTAAAAAASERVNLLIFYRFPI